MLQYVDSFFCTYNSLKKNYVIRLRQEEPVQETSDSQNVTIQTNEVGNIVLSEACAMELAHAILQLNHSDHYFPVFSVLPVTWPVSAPVQYHLKNIFCLHNFPFYKNPHSVLYRVGGGD